MIQLADDCFAFGSDLMPMADALDLLAQRTSAVVGREEVALSEAHGRILARNLTSAVDVPAHDNAAVDGYALRFEDLKHDGETAFRVAGRAAAGHPMAAEPNAGQAVRIFTGAVMPERTDTVVMQEDVRLDGDTVVVPAGLKRGANRRLRGEDTKSGAPVLAKGRRLRAQDIGLAASVGCARLDVYKRLKVAVFSSGDELAEPGAALAVGGVFDSNRYMLLALLRELGCAVDDIAILPDRFEAVRDGLANAATSHDLLVTSGGVSTGEEDHIKAAITELGKLHFWRLAIKPGRPLAVGQVGNVPFVGLPGNPVAVLVCFLRIARYLVLRLAGAEGPDLAPHFFSVRAGFRFEKKRGRREWIRARIATNDEGLPVALRYPAQGSGVLRSMVESDGLIELDEDTTLVEEGEAVPFLPFSEVMG